MAIDVRDALSNRPEHVVEAATAIGRSVQKRAVFEAAYYHKQQKKSVSEIAIRTNLTNKQVLMAGKALVERGLLQQDRKGSEVAYVQIPFFQHHKRAILALVDHPDRIPKVITKRNLGLSFQRPVGLARRRAISTRAVGEKKFRIAFLATNPDGAASLRTDMEARAVQRALKQSSNVSEIDVRHLPAATAGDLVLALNEYRPHIVHFAGHGGDGALLFDDENLGADGGAVIEFSLVRDILAATDHPASMLVFSACDTLEGAEIFLPPAKAVVAMSSAIGDASAIVFSAAFYAGLAGKQSLGSALEQGRNAIKLARLGDFDLPQCLMNRDMKAGSYIPFG